MAVLDTSILVGAAIARHATSVTVRVVEAAISGLYVCVLSDSIREETLAVLERFDVHRESADGLFRPLWDRAVWVDLGTESGDLAKAVRGDVKDVHVLRTALGIYENRPDLADRPRYLVSENTSDFVSGRIRYGFRFRSANEFLQELSQARPAD